jgi:hypothetical protein
MGIFPPYNKGGVPPGPNVVCAYTPQNTVIGEGPLFVSPACSTILTDCQVNAFTSEILAAVDQLGFPFNSDRVDNLGDALVLMRDQLNRNIDTRVAKAGDIMTGALILPSTNPTNDNEATRKGYVDGQLSSAVGTLNGRIDAEAQTAATCCNSRVNRAGDVMTGPLQLAGEPTSPGEAVNKAYVDDALAYGRGRAVVSPSPPTDPTDGLLWFDAVSGGLFIFYVDDADNGQWVNAC